MSELQAAVPMVPMVQVHQADAPGIPFPEGTDLLQVLWCPYGHGEYCYPLPQVHWRDSRGIGDVLSTPAPVEGLPPDWYPNPCVVHPEQVNEYPSNDLSLDMRDVLRQRFDELHATTGL